MPGYAALQNHKDQLVRKGVQGSAFLANSTANVIDKTTLFDAVTGAIKTLPAGYHDLGLLTDTGAVFARKVTSTDIPAWGHNDPVRSDITTDTTTCAVQCEETKLQTIGLGANVDPSTIVPGVNGVFDVPHSSAPVTRNYRMFVVLADNVPGGEIIIAKFFPRVSVTSYDGQSYSNGKDALLWGFTFTAYLDSTVGYAQDDLYGGDGMLSLLDDMDMPRIVTATVALTTALVITTGAVTPGDAGRPLSGVGIAPGTTILTVTDATHVVMSAAGTTAGAGVAVTIGS
jgi:hypothetical protein